MFVGATVVRSCRIDSALLSLDQQGATSALNCPDESARVSPERPDERAALARPLDVERRVREGGYTRIAIDF